MKFRVVFALFFCLAATLTFSTEASAQEYLSRKQLEHADYDAWNTMQTRGMSRDGNWVMFVVQNGAIDGEATVTFRNVKTNKQYTIERGSGPRFSFDSKFAIYRVTPSKKEVRRLRKANSKTKGKSKPQEMPKASFHILELETGDLTTVENVKSFLLPEENGDWVACLLEKSNDAESIKSRKANVSESFTVTESGLERPKKKLKLKKRESESVSEENKPEEKETAAEKESAAKAKIESGSAARKASTNKSNDEKKSKSVGTRLVLINLKTGLQRSWPDVSRYEFSKGGQSLAFATSVESEKPKATDADESDGDSKSDDGAVTDGVTVIALSSLKQSKVASGHGNYRGLTFSDDGSKLAFVTDKDDYDSKTSSMSLYLWKSGSKNATKIAAEGEDGIPDQWWIAPGSTQSFSEDGKRLYFDTAPIPEQVLNERDDVEDDQDDMPKLDIWHWQDPQLQPQQLIQAQRERNRSYEAAWILRKKKIVQLATKDVPDISIDVRRKSSLAVAVSDMPYRKMMSWDLPGYRDAWLVNLDTGEKEKILEKVKWFPSISPDGKFVVWFDGEQQKWFAMATAKGSKREPVCISEGIEYPLYDELHDTPNVARAYGTAGWLKSDAGILIYDRYDIWQLDPTGESKPVCITGGKGRESNLRFRYLRLDREQRSIDPEQDIYLSCFDTKSKASGFWKLSSVEKKERSGSQPPLELSRLIMLDESIGGLQKAELSDNVIFTRSKFEVCPDLWQSDLAFKKIHRLSDINPQQDQYLWGKAELVHWDSARNEPLDGILIKPEGFDASKKYPLMVYFYERNSDNLHRYYAPTAGRSIINFSFYASRGYLIFIPDIPYTTGQPGQSAADAILPGVESLIEQGFVDPKRIGMQGHSWGGYQTAWLVTQTDMFACAESGAPVSNMTSAYGGIRWSSGMSRMFQYERTQSRIGEDLWAARDKYIQNSPVFFADRINTPLLILHNDEDGAVPWYQGIELFVALRRLEKPAWMLNYNGNPHWVMGEVNRRDFARRMQQFFDHYLMDAPEPEWMAVGVPAVNKGKELGMELLEPVEEKSAKEEPAE